MGGRPVRTLFLLAVAAALMFQAGAPAFALTTDESELDSEEVDSAEEEVNEEVNDQYDEADQETDDAENNTSSQTDAVDDTVDSAQNTSEENVCQTFDTEDSTCSDATDADEQASNKTDDTVDTAEEECTEPRIEVGNPCDAQGKAVNNTDCGKDRVKATCTDDAEENATRLASGITGFGGQSAGDNVEWVGQELQGMDPVCMWHYWLCYGAGPDYTDLLESHDCPDGCPWDQDLECHTYPEGRDGRCENMPQAWARYADDRAGSALGGVGQEVEKQADTVRGVEEAANESAGDAVDTVEAVQEAVCSAQARTAIVGTEVRGPFGGNLLSSSAEATGEASDPCQTAKGAVDNPFFGACGRSAGVSGNADGREFDEQASTSTACNTAASVAHGICDPTSRAEGAVGEAQSATGQEAVQTPTKGEGAQKTANGACDEANTIARETAEMYAESCRKDQARLHGTFGAETHAAAASFSGRADVAAEVTWAGTTEDERTLCHEDRDGVPSDVDPVPDRFSAKPETAFELDMYDTWSGDSVQPDNATVSVEVKLSTLGIPQPDAFDDGWKDQINASVRAHGSVILHHDGDRWVDLDTSVAGVVRTEENGSTTVYVTLEGDTSGFSPFVVATETDHDPTAVFETTPDGLSVSVDASGSSADDGIAKYEWSFAGQATKAGETASHTFDSDGTYTITLTVQDNDGDKATASKEVSVSAGNTGPSIDLTSDCTGLTCTFDASGSSDPDGAVASIDWTFGTGHVADGSSIEYTFASAGTYTVDVTVTDDGGATATQSHVVEVEAAPGEQADDPGPGDGSGSGDDGGADEGSGTSGDGSGAPTWMPGPIAELVAALRNPLVIVGLFVAVAATVGVYVGYREREDGPGEPGAEGDDPQAEPGS